MTPGGTRASIEILGLFNHMPYRFLIAAAMLFSASLYAPRPVLGSCGDWLAHPNLPEAEQESRVTEAAVSIPAAANSVAALRRPRLPSGSVRTRTVTLLAEFGFASGRFGLFGRAQRWPWIRSARRVLIGELLLFPSGYVLNIDRPPQS